VPIAWGDLAPTFCFRENRIWLRIEYDSSSQINVVGDATFVRIVHLERDVIMTVFRIPVCAVHFNLNVIQREIVEKNRQYDDSKGEKDENQSQQLDSRKSIWRFPTVPRFHSPCLPNYYQIRHG
jgi:hypothetical protein